MAKEEGKEKEEVISIKKISKIELEELQRLHTIAAQAPNRVIGTINLQTESRKNLFDYHTALSKKYGFNPFYIGINRFTGDLQLLPAEVLQADEKERKKKSGAMNKLIKQLAKTRNKGNKKDEQSTGV